jgi:hypothetical protein
VERVEVVLERILDNHRALQRTTLQW